MSDNQEQHNNPSETYMPGRGKKRGKIMFLAVLLVGIAAAGGWYYKSQTNGSEADRPLLATVEYGSIENTISAAGTLKPSELVEVGAQVSGQLQQLLVEVGDVVEEGQLLAEIDARVQVERVNASQASLEAQEAQLVSRQSALELARANAERQEKLFAADASSQLEYDNAIDRLASAEASLVQLQKQIEQSRASLKTEVTELEFASIYAPVSGTVVSIAMNEGRTLNATQQAPTILTIADLNTMTVETEVSEADIGKIKRGMEVYFTTLGNGERRWNSTLRQILPTPVVTNNIVLYTALFDVDNSDNVLMPEMTTQVYFVSSSAENVLTIPMGAVTFLDQPAPGGQMSAMAGDPDAAQVQGSIPGGGANGERPQLTEEMRQRIQQMRESGNFPAGGGQAAGRGNFGGAGFGQARITQPGQRSLARVTVVNADGTQEQREVVIGLTSRVKAEVISGLKVGEQVVAGIVEAAIPGNQSSDNNRNFRPPMMFR